MSTLSIGWDVGGWQGKNHGFALMKINSNRKPVIIGKPITLKIPNSQKQSGGLFELEKVVEEAGGGQLSDYEKVVVAVDAPLGLPSAFKKFINDTDYIERRPGIEIDNPLAYRLTERDIYKTVGKKPLSAPFGRLGTSMTVAMTHARYWAKKGFKTAPQQGVEIGKKVIIETYPAAMKELEAFKQPEKYGLPNFEFLSDHEKDAAICALVGLCYLKEDASFIGENVEIHHPEPRDSKCLEKYAEEGWIYHLT